MHKVSIPDYALARGQMMRPPLSITPATTALIAIDFQRFFIDADQPMGNVHARDVLDNANRLHNAVRDAGGLVVFTQHSMGAPPAPDARGEYPSPTGEARSGHELLPGSVSYELHPAMQRASGDLSIVKYQSSPLHQRAATGLDAQLRARGIDTVIVTGLVTNGCCDCTARDAFQHGYKVIVASDATAAMSDEEHNSALLNLTIYYAYVEPGERIIAALG
jgi:ureidoacrylate peracid hydrolase